MSAGVSYQACHDNDVWVELSEAELWLACTHGKRMWEKSHADGRTDTHRWEGFARVTNGRTQGLRNQQLGAVVEQCVAKALDIHWPSTIDAGRLPDFPKHRIEARLIGQEFYGLRVKPGDVDSKRVVGVVIPPGTERGRHRIPGWIVAGDAKREEWSIDPHGRPPIFAVPQERLRPLAELKAEIVRAATIEWGLAAKRETVPETDRQQTTLWADEPERDRLVMWENGGWIPF